jgi:hypothetical protein
MLRVSVKFYYDGWYCWAEDLLKFEMLTLFLTQLTLRLCMNHKRSSLILCSRFENKKPVKLGRAFRSQPSFL